MINSHSSRREVLKTAGAAAACGIGASTVRRASAIEVFPANAVEETDFELETGEEVYATEFESLDDWLIETEDDDQAAQVTDDGLVIASEGGTTAWLDREFSGDVVIEYEAFIPTEGDHAEAFTLNQFWMASDTAEDDGLPPIGERSGAFPGYNDLNMYYACVCRPHLRFRRYPRAGYRTEGNSLKGQYKGQEYEEYKLDGDTTYTIQCIQYGDQAALTINGSLFFRWVDPNPLTAGLFGLRIWQSRAVYRSLSVNRVTDLSVRTPTPTETASSSQPSATTQSTGTEPTGATDTTGADGPGFGAGAALLGLGAAGLQRLRD